MLTETSKQGGCFYNGLKTIIDFETSYVSIRQQSARANLPNTALNVLGGISGAVKGATSAIVLGYGAPLPIMAWVTLSLFPPNTFSYLATKTSKFSDKFNKWFFSDDEQLSEDKQNLSSTVIGSTYLESIGNWIPTLETTQYLVTNGLTLYQNLLPVNWFKIMTVEAVEQPLRWYHGGILPEYYTKNAVSDWVWTLSDIAGQIVQSHRLLKNTYYGKLQPLSNIVSSTISNINYLPSIIYGNSDNIIKTVNLSGYLSVINTQHVFSLILSSVVAPLFSISRNNICFKEKFNGISSNFIVLANLLVFPTIRADNTVYLQQENLNGILNWRYQVFNNVGSSSPAIASDGTIYISAAYLYAITPSGSLKWQYPISGGSLSSPAIGSDGTVYMEAGDKSTAYLYALTPSGSLKWQYQIGWHVYSDLTSSPAIDSYDIIYIGSGDGYLYAITQSGSLKWRYRIGAAIASSPAIDSNGTIYIGSSDGYLYAISPPSGILKWRYQTYGGVHSSPAIASDGTIYVGSRDNYLYAITPSGILKWRYQTYNGIVSSPTIGVDGTIYVGSGDYYLYSITSDGNLKWRYLAGGGVFSAPTIGSDGTIYVGSCDGSFYAITNAGDLKWLYKTGCCIDMSSPAIGSDGTVYVGSCDGYLYAVNNTVLLSVSSPWPKFHRNNQNTGFRNTILTATATATATAISIPIDITTLDLSQQTSGVTADLTTRRWTCSTCSPINIILDTVVNILGSLYDDTLTGDSKSNVINGNDGNDIIDGAGGYDTLTGGNGADKFIITQTSSSGITITDFNFNDGDRIDLSSLNPIRVPTLEQLLSSTQDVSVGADYYCQINGIGKTTIILNGIYKEQITALCFIPTLISNDMLCAALKNNISSGISPYEYMKLSNAVYYLNQPDMPESLKVSYVPTGWSVLLKEHYLNTPSPIKGRTIFTLIDAVAFVKDINMVIAFEQKYDAQIPTHVAYSDTFQFFDGLTADIYRITGVHFIKEAVTKYATNNRLILPVSWEEDNILPDNELLKVSFTGHGIGSDVAVICAGLFLRPAVVFYANGFGLSDITDPDSSQYYPINAPTYTKTNVFIFNCAPTIHNTNIFGDQAANFYRVYPQAESSLASIKKLYSLAGQPDNKLYYGYGAAFDVTQDDYDLLSGGFPKVFSIENGWPDNGYEDYLSFACNPDYWWNYRHSDHYISTSLIAVEVLQSLGELAVDIALLIATDGIFTALAKTSGFISVVEKALQNRAVGGIITEGMRIALFSKEVSKIMEFKLPDLVKKYIIEGKALKYSLTESEIPEKAVQQGFKVTYGFIKDFINKIINTDKNINQNDVSCNFLSSEIISPDNGSNIISTKVQSGLTIISAGGNDTFNIYGQNTVIYDTGGDDTYKFISYGMEDSEGGHIISEGNIGKNTIIDVDSRGSIYIGFSEKPVKGYAYTIIEPKATILDQYYIRDNGAGFFARKDGDDLLVLHGGPEVLSQPNEFVDYVRIVNFRFGDFGILEGSREKLDIVLGDFNNTHLDVQCGNSEKKCVVIPYDRTEYITAASRLNVEFLLARAKYFVKSKNIIGNNIEAINNFIASNPLISFGIAAFLPGSTPFVFGIVQKPIILKILNSEKTTRHYKSFMPLSNNINETLTINGFDIIGYSLGLKIDLSEFNSSVSIFTQGNKQIISVGGFNITIIPSSGGTSYNNISLTELKFNETTGIIETALNATFISSLSITAPIIGTNFNDKLMGDWRANIIQGIAGNDTLEGMGGADILDGGEGMDTVIYSWSTSGVNISLSTNQSSGGHAQNNTLISIENVIGSVYNDVLIGDNSANVLQGGGGDDVLEGKGGTDLLDGGDGIDVATYISSPQGIVINLNGSTIFGKGGDAEGDVLLNIENLIGSNYSDILTGSLLTSVAQVLQGGGGNDVLIAVAYNSTMLGQADVDTFEITKTAYNTLIADFNTSFEKVDLTTLNVQYIDIQKFQTSLGCVLNFTYLPQNILINNTVCSMLTLNNFIMNVKNRTILPDDISPSPVNQVASSSDNNINIFVPIGVVGGCVIAAAGVFFGYKLCKKNKEKHTDVTYQAPRAISVNSNEMVVESCPNQQRIPNNNINFMAHARLNYS